MPTLLPPPRVLPWTSLARAMWLRVRIACLGARMRHLPTSHPQACCDACRFLAYSREFHALMGQPEPERVAAMREAFERPFTDGSTLIDRYDPRP